VFSSATAPKVEHLRADPVAHLLVANQVGEPEPWVSITADVELGPVDPGWLESLSARYWDLDQDEHRSVVDGWLEHLDALVLLTLRPSTLRESASEHARRVVRRGPLNRRRSGIRSPRTDRYLASTQWDWTLRHATAGKAEK
jgi:hypothetical protein